MPRTASAGFPFASLLLVAVGGTNLTQAAGAAPDSASGLEAAVQTAGSALQQAWKGDPATADLPWPPLRLRSPGAGLAADCPGARGSSQDTSSLFCPASGELLLDARALGREQERYGTWGVAYWIATGLAEAFLARQSSGTAAPGAALHLQAVCLAGVLLDSSPGLQPAEPAQQLSPARTAYASTDAATQGTRRQRAYALLSGFGATASDCTAAAMKGLAADRVRDPQLLEEAGEDPGNRALTGVSSAQIAICRKPLRCPRQVGAVFSASRP